MRGGFSSNEPNAAFVSPTGAARDDGDARGRFPAKVRITISSKNDDNLFRGTDMNPKRAAHNRSLIEKTGRNDA